MMVTAFATFAVADNGLQFSAEVYIPEGTLDFNQEINSSDVGHFDNFVDMTGTDLRLLNVASETWVAPAMKDLKGNKSKETYVKGHHAITFGQDLYMNESSSDFVGFQSVQKFTDLSRQHNYIQQMIDVYPVPNDWGDDVEDDFVDLWNGDLNSGQGMQGMLSDRVLPDIAGGRAMLSQNGDLKGDYVFAKQSGNVPSVEGYTSIGPLYYTPSTVNLANQTVVWTGNWS